jgi:signal peptidase I
VRKFLRDNATFLVAMFLLLAARSSLADHYVVPSGSMQSTLMPGDRVFVDKHAYGLRVPFTNLEVADTGAPQRGDVVIFPSPADGVRLVKRVVAVGGDVVEVRGGRVRVNGEFAASDDAGEHERLGAHEFALSLDQGPGPDQVPVRVPEGHVFVLGDARGNSKDSRFFGFVREDTIYARASSVYFRRGDGFVWRAL